MDSQINLKVNQLQRDLADLEEKELRLAKELETVVDQIKIVRRELDEIMKDERITKDILGRVYEQRRTPDKDKNKSKR